MADTDEYIDFVNTFRNLSSEVSYEGYESDWIVFGQTISFMNLQVIGDSFNFDSKLLKFWDSKFFS